MLIVARHLVASATVERPEWERTLDKLLADSPAVPAADVVRWRWSSALSGFPRFGATSGVRICIRPARRSSSGGWLRSGISWDDLDLVARSYVAEQRELLLQFRGRRTECTVCPAPECMASLGTVSSAFWGLLDQAATVGLTILAAALLGPLRTEQRASVALDVRRDPAVGVLVGPGYCSMIRSWTSSLGVLGDPAHGVFSVGEQVAGVPADRGTAGSAAEPRTAAAVVVLTRSGDSAGGRGHF